MATLDYNKKFNNNYIPNLLKVTDFESVRQNNDLIDNVAGVKLFENQEQQIYLKEVFQVKNYAKCFSISSTLQASYASRIDTNGRPRNMVYASLYSYSGNENAPLQLTLRNFWVAKLGTKVENGQTVSIVNEDKSYILMNKGYLCFYAPKNLVSNYDDSTINQQEGYISSVNFVMNASQDSEGILSKFAINSIDIQHMDYQSQRDLLDSLGFSSPYSDSYRGVQLYAITLDGTGLLWDEIGGGYDIPFFAKKEYNDCRLDINTSRNWLEDGSYKYESNIFQVPVKLTLQNELIQFLTDYSTWGSIVEQYVSKAQGSGWYSHFQVWCPDQTYLSFVINQVEIKATIEEQNWNPYRYVKFSFNIDNKNVGDIMYLTFVFTYSKGDVYYQKTHGIKITVRE